MNIAITLPLLTLALAQTPTPERPPHPLAPSLPTLTKEQEKYYDQIIDRFILADIGKLTGAEGKKAMDDFKRLPAESFFNLVNGFNRAADMEDSCPAVLISRRLTLIINSSSDLQLLAFARENLGAGVTAKRHVNVIGSLRAAITFRRGEVQRAQLAARVNTPPAKTTPAVSWDKLAKSVETAKGPALQQTLLEVEKRKEPEAYKILALAAARPEKDVRNFSLQLLAKHVAQEPADQLKKLSAHESPAVRLVAIQNIQQRGLKYGAELIERLADDDFEVVTAARLALVQLARGQDFGPASQGERDQAITRWRQWWGKQ